MTPARAAETAFRWLMRAYPPEFRRAHGLALFELFRDDLRAAAAERGVSGVAAVTGRAAIDTVRAAPGAWIGRRLNDGGRERWWRGGAQEVRFAARLLARSPVFAAIAIATLAIGIGATLTIFSLIDAVLLRPLAPRDPAHVVRISGRTVTGRPTRRFSFPDLQDYRRQARSLSDVAGVTLVPFVLEADNRTDQIIGEVASGSYLPLLGVPIAYGRTLTEADDRDASSPVVVISDALWRRRFNRDDVVGKLITLNRSHYTIVGVAGDGFGGSFVGAPIDVWMPLASAASSLEAHWRDDRARQALMLIGRLAPGVTAGQAQAELQVIAEALARQYRPELHPIVEVLPATLAWGDQRRLAEMFLSLLLALVTLVLVIACANVGNLLLARVAGRRRELAIRIALGASSSGLARLLVIEGVLISAAGGAAAVAVAAWTRRAFSSIAPLPTLTLRFDMRPDMRVVLFAIGATVATAIVLGGIGALHAMRASIAPALSEESAAGVGGRSPSRLRTALAALQIAVSLLLLVGAALLVRSVRGAATIDLGFDPRGVVAVDVDGAGGRTAADRDIAFRRAIHRLSTLPGVEAAAVATRAPLDSSTPIARVNVRPVSTAEDASPIASFMMIGPRYFDVVKTPIVAGRPFTEDDSAARPAVAIVNETLARRLWPEGSAIGQRLWLEAHASADPCVVVGVARNSRYLTLGEEGQAHVYLPSAQHPRTGTTLLVRSAVEPNRMMREMQEALSAVDPQAIGFFPRTLTEHVAASLVPIRLARSLAVGLAGLALALAALGLYGLVSFVVAERTREIGLRVALGATDRQVMRLVVGFGLKLAGAGLAIGIPAALAGSRLLGTLLYGVSATDPAVFAAAPAMVVAVALAACCVPAVRAVRLDPIQAIRNQ